jgi:hypothetical protein
MPKEAKDPVKRLASQQKIRKLKDQIKMEELKCKVKAEAEEKKKQQQQKDPSKTKKKASPKKGVTGRVVSVAGVPVDSTAKIFFIGSNMTPVKPKPKAPTAKAADVPKVADLAAQSLKKRVDALEKLVQGTMVSPTSDGFDI